MAVSNSAYPDSVDRLIEEFASLPGIGRRSAERLAFHVLKSSKDEALGLARAIDEVKNNVGHCGICWNLTDSDPCHICADHQRDHLAAARDRAFGGRSHPLGGSIGRDRGGT